MDRARAALREPTAKMRVVEPDLVAQHVQERRIRCDLDGSRLAVQLEDDAFSHFRTSLGQPGEVNTSRLTVHEPALRPRLVLLSAPTPRTGGREHQLGWRAPLRVGTTSHLASAAATLTRCCSRWPLDKRRLIRDRRR